MLLNVTGGEDLGLLEINEAAQVVQEAADPDANIIFGAVIDENLKDEIRITVIATGFEDEGVNEVKKDIKKDIKEAKSQQEAASALDNTGSFDNSSKEDLDIPAFLRRQNRSKY